MASPFNFSPDKLTHLYRDLEMSCADIAKHIHKPLSTVEYHVVKLGIKRRQSEANRLSMWKHWKASCEGAEKAHKDKWVNNVFCAQCCDGGNHFKGLIPKVAVVNGRCPIHNCKVRYGPRRHSNFKRKYPNGVKPPKWTKTLNSR